MTLDERLRGTYQRQLRQVEDRLAQSSADASFRPTGRALLPRLVMVGAFAALAVVGIVGATRLLDQPGVPLDAGDAQNQESSDGRPTTTVEPLVVDADTPTSTPPADEGPGTPTSTSAPEPTEDPSTGRSTVPPTTVTPSTTESGVATDPVPHDGVANEVCPSGARAELETASLRYVSEAQGWGRLDDLVDEQNGPYYFEAWEPNFDRPVTVEIALAEPVMATEIRVAQDPFTEVGGTISISADEDAEAEIAIELSGVGDWKVHRYPEPTLLRTLTVTRQNAASNIMEIMVCVVPTE